MLVLGLLEHLHSPRDRLELRRLPTREQPLQLLGLTGRSQLRTPARAEQVTEASHLSTVDRSTAADAVATP